MKATVGLVICNGSVANIYEAKIEGSEFNVKKTHEFHHAESRLKTSDLVTDRTGHYSKGAHGRGAYNEKTSPKELELQHFSHELAGYIENLWKEKHHQGVVISTPPHFESLLKEALAPHEKHMGGFVKAMLTKDYTRETVKELEEIFEPICREALKP